MFRIEAPYPGVQEIMHLPNPLFGNSENANVDVFIKKAMDGTKQTHVKTTGTRTFNFSFNVTRTMAIQFRSFCESWLHRTMRIRIFYPDNTTIIDGVIIDNPISITMDSRNNVTLQFSFEGVIK